MRTTINGHCESWPRMRLVRGESCVWIEFRDENDLLHERDRIAVFFDPDLYENAQRAIAAFNAEMLKPINMEPDL